jgi:hypothetical protein
MPGTDDATPRTTIYDPEVLADLARQAREAAQEMTGTDEHRAVGEVVRFRPARES